LCAYIVDNIEEDDAKTASLRNFMHQTSHWLLTTIPNSSLSKGMLGSPQKFYSSSEF
jgi:hypothetical protein